MATQSELERIGIDERQDEIIHGKIHANDDSYKSKEFTGDIASEYTVDNPNAQADGDAYGKGTGSETQALNIPTVKKDYTHKQLGIAVETSKGGGEYDINGTQGVTGAFQGNAGRKYLTSGALNPYTSSNPYGEGSVDTTINRTAGQYVVK